MRVLVRSRRLPWWVVALITVQVGVPGYLLVAGEQPRRLGFQMYSALGSVSVQAFDAAGNEIVLPEQLTEHLRVDLPWLEHLPEQVCEIEPRAATVTVGHRSVERTATC